MDLDQFKACVPSLTNVSRVSQVFKGFSYDEKYFVYEDGLDTPKYVLRTSPLKQVERKRQEFERVLQVHAQGVKTSQPIIFGVNESLEKCYMVLSYVEGEDAFDVLPNLKEDEQYQIGVEAGQELNLIHELSAPNMESWSARRLAKHHRQIEGYRKCGIKVEEESAILSFIEETIPYMLNRPNRFQHDDFHPSNLIVHNRCYAGVIDFNRYDWGDPYHEFLKIAYFSREVSIPFSIGQILGYFNEDVPLEFWHLYSLYTAMIIFPTVTWTLEVIPNQMESMMRRIQIVLEDHRNFESVIPVWFKP